MKKLRENTKGIGIGTAISFMMSAVSFYFAMHNYFPYVLFRVGGAFGGIFVILLFVHLAATSEPDHTFQKQSQGDSN